MSLNEEKRKTQLSDTLDVRHYYEPNEFTWGQVLVRAKGRPIFFYKDEVKGYVDAKTLRDYYRDHGLSKPRAKGKKPPKRKKTTRKERKRGDILGKVISKRNNNKKSKSDHYPTPPPVTQSLIEFLNLPKETKVWEPACGAGHISQTLQLNGYGKVMSSDLYNYGYGHVGVDFLKHAVGDYDWIITNPPFNLAEQFIARAWKNQKPFAFLLKNSYWNSVKRRELFIATKPTHVLPLTWRPDFSFEEKHSTMDCMWVVWGPASFNKYENQLDENFTTEYFPLKRPQNAPIMDIKGKLLFPFHPFHKDIY